MQKIVSGGVRNVHVPRMQSCTDALAITAEYKKVFPHAFPQEEFEMAAIVDIYGERGETVEVKWVGFDKKENTWGDLAKMRDAAAQFVESELRKLVLKQRVRHVVVSAFAIFV